MSDPARHQDDDDRIRSAAAAWIVAVEGRPSTRTQARLDRWLTADPRHAAAYRRLAGRFDGARMLRGSNVYTARPVPVRRRARRTIAAGAAAIAAVALSAILRPVDLVRNDPSTDSSQRVASNTSGRAAFRRNVSTPVAGIRSIGLADGSIVTMDGGSTLNIDYTPATRLITLRRGRARFEVAHDGRPFTVLAGGGSVAARGTTFDVTRTAGGPVDVLLLRGFVDVAPRTSSSLAQPVRHLKAGESTSFANGAMMLRRDLASADSTPWIVGDVEFDNVSLDYVIGAINAAATPRIGLADPAIGRLRVSGRFDLTNPDQLARNLSRLFDLNVEPRPGGVRLVRR